MRTYLIPLSMIMMLNLSGLKSAHAESPPPESKIVISRTAYNQCLEDAKTITKCHKDKVDAKSDAALARRDLERVEKRSRAALEKKDAAIIALNARYDDRPDVVRWVGGTLVGVCVAGALINTYVPGEEWTMFNGFCGS